MCCEYVGLSESHLKRNKYAFQDEEDLKNKYNNYFLQILTLINQKLLKLQGIKSSGVDLFPFPIILNILLEVVCNF
jgi:hypothetical protein